MINKDRLFLMSFWMVVAIYLSDAIDCAAPQWYDARAAPSAPWVFRCLMQIKMPPAVPFSTKTILNSQ